MLEVQALGLCQGPGEGALARNMCVLPCHALTELRARERARQCTGHNKIHVLYNPTA